MSTSDAHDAPEQQVQGRPNAPQRLYGLPGAEHLYDDPATVYETEIDPWADEQDRRPWEIEEWTVRPPIDLIPSTDWLLEWVGEHMADEMTDEDGAVERTMKKPEVVEAAEALRQAIARHSTFFMADQLVATHTVTWSDDTPDAEPMLDGEPMYVKAGGSSGE